MIFVISRKIGHLFRGDLCFPEYTWSLANHEVERPPHSSPFGEDRPPTFEGFTKSQWIRQTGKFVGLSGRGVGRRACRVGRGQGIREAKARGGLWRGEPDQGRLIAFQTGVGRQTGGDLRGRKRKECATSDSRRSQTTSPRQYTDSPPVTMVAWREGDGVSGGNQSGVVLNPCALCTKHVGCVRCQA
jgi:hypothetical protein